MSQLAMFESKAKTNPESKDIHAATVDDLQTLKLDMQTALGRGEWQDLADLDRKCRRLVSEIIGNQKVDETLLQALTETIRFYEKLVNACQQNKNELADQSISLRRSKAKDNVYRAMSAVT